MYLARHQPRFVNDLYLSDDWLFSKDGSLDWNVPPTIMDRDKHNTKNLKKCVVGEGCKIHETAKLANCIVMRNVTVTENAVLEVRAFL